MMVILKKTSRPDGGFTLLEVMIAITLVAIVFVPLLSLRNQNISQTYFARQSLRAAFLANEKLSKLQLETTPEPGETHGDFGEKYPDFRWIETVSKTPLVGIKEVKLNILWKKGTRDESMEWIQYVQDIP